MPTVGRPGSGVLRSRSDLDAALEYRPIGEWIDTGYLARLAHRLGHDYRLPAEEMADLLQDIRLALCQAGLDRKVNSTWIYHTALHKAVDRIRSGMKQARVLRTKSSSAVADDQLLHLLRARLSLLPPRLQVFCNLRYRLGLSSHEVSDRLGVSRASVRWLERKALRLLREGKSPSRDTPAK